MPLDDLFTLIHELRERIDAHGAALRQNEALTRYALIDPLLRALGWNTADPPSWSPSTARAAARRTTPSSATANPS